MVVTFSSVSTILLQDGDDDVEIVDKVDLQLTCPQRGVMERSNPEFFPFGNTSALNVLKAFDGLEPFDDDGTGVNVKILLVNFKISRIVTSILCTDSLPGMWRHEEPSCHCYWGQPQSIPPHSHQ